MTRPTKSNDRLASASQVLATDLDGTLIPLTGNQQNRADLQTLADGLRDHGAELLFVTGRHLESIVQIAQEHHLRPPNWIIGDVGASIFQRREGTTGWEFLPVAEYYDHQDEIVSELPMAKLRELLPSLAGLRLQEDQKQGRFKLSYYADAIGLSDLVKRIQQTLLDAGAPYSVIHSVDPFNGDGLLDLLPINVSKAYALAWWVRHRSIEPGNIVFAGDSGNDLAALTAGYRSIVVGNADRAVARQVDERHRQASWNNRLYLAEGHATSGVLEGCHWFGLLPPDDVSPDRLGATQVSHDTTQFLVWVPKRRRVSVELIDGDQSERFRLERREGGYFAGNVVGATAGSMYRILLDHQIARPDPASRFQPEGVHGPSQIVDHRCFAWTDQNWQNVAKQDLIIYELHVGTFTHEGTFRGAIERIPELVDLGVTAIELMPVAQTPGRWNWGYDGVNLFAARNSYGHPDDLKALVDACHAAGVAVLLDVVYNHLGPEGNYLSDFGPYFSNKHHTPWGEAFNFDGKHSDGVRRLIVENAVYWLEEFHLDGLRLDAVHFLIDDSDFSILDEIRQATTAFEERTGRKVHLIAEANVYDKALLTPNEVRTAYDAIWCDCLMHSLYGRGVPDLKLTVRDYNHATDLAEALEHGYLYEDAKQRRIVRKLHNEIAENASVDKTHISAFVTGLQTHDSVGNHPGGLRFHQLTSKEFQRAAAGLMLLYPSIPLLFMGEEYATETPFPFFADFEDATLRTAVDEGRRREYPQHDWSSALLPSHRDAFFHAKCHAEQHCDTEMFAWYRQLIALRKKGLDTGWLSPERMSLEHDHECDLFTLRYDRTGGGRITIHARLSPPTRKHAKAVLMRLPGEILLSSEKVPSNTTEVAMQPAHTVICET